MSTQYLVHNGAVSSSTRKVRAAQPTHRGRKQYILGHQARLIPGRPVTISEEQLKAYLADFQDREDRGLLFVTTLDRRAVNLKTLEIGEVLPVPPPVAPLNDLVENDPPAGMMIPTYAGEAPPPDEFQMPVPPPDAAVAAPVIADATEVTPPAPVETEVPTAPETPSAQQQDKKSEKKKGGR